MVPDSGGSPSIGRRGRMKRLLYRLLHLQPYRVEDDELAQRILDATHWLRAVRMSGEPLTGDLFPQHRRRAR